MEFLKSSELELNPAGYLIGTKSGKPVNHASFVEQQQKAHYVVTLANAVKGKTFKYKKLDNLDSIKEEVMKSISSANVRNYVTEPTKPVSKVNDELVKFALDFVSYEEAKDDANKINKFMNEFNSIADIESVGDYFTEGLVKLNKIYSISEIQFAVESYELATK